MTIVGSSGKGSGMNHEFVTEHVHFMPDKDDYKEGVIYVSNVFGSVQHICPCGCGHRVVTPVDKPGGKRWTLTLDNDGRVTLAPSILNRWACGSHYFIRHGCVVWA